MTLHAHGGLGAPYTLTVAGGHLPAGLSLSRGGTISGTPTVAGTFQVTVSVDHQTHKRYSLIIDTPTPTTTPATSATATSAPATTAPIGAPTPAFPSSSATLAATGVRVADLAALSALAIALGATLLVLALASRRRTDRLRRTH